MIVTPASTERKVDRVFVLSYKHIYIPWIGGSLKYNVIFPDAWMLPTSSSFRARTFDKNKLIHLMTYSIP